MDLLHSEDSSGRQFGDIFFELPLLVVYGDLFISFWFRIYIYIYRFRIYIYIGFN